MSISSSGNVAQSDHEGDDGNNNNNNNNNNSNALTSLSHNVFHHDTDAADHHTNNEDGSNSVDAVSLAIANIANNIQGDIAAEDQDEAQVDDTGNSHGEEYHDPSADVIANIVDGIFDNINSDHSDDNEDGNEGRVEKRVSEQEINNTKNEFIQINNNAEELSSEKANESSNTPENSNVNKTVDDNNLSDAVNDAIAQIVNNTQSQLANENTDKYIESSKKDFHLEKHGQEQEEETKEKVKDDEKNDDSFVFSNDLNDAIAQMVSETVNQISIEKDEQAESDKNESQIIIQNGQRENVVSTQISRSEPKETMLPVSTQIDRPEPSEIDDAMSNAIAQLVTDTVNEVGFQNEEETQITELVPSQIGTIKEAKRSLDVKSDESLASTEQLISGVVSEMMKNVSKESNISNAKQTSTSNGKSEVSTEEPGSVEAAISEIVKGVVAQASALSIDDNDDSQDFDDYDDSDEPDSAEAAIAQIVKNVMSQIPSQDKEEHFSKNDDFQFAMHEMIKNVADEIIEEEDLDLELRGPQESDLQMAIEEMVKNVVDETYEENVQQNIASSRSALIESLINKNSSFSSSLTSNLTNSLTNNLPSLTNNLTSSSTSNLTNNLTSSLTSTFKYNLTSNLTSNSSSTTSSTDAKNSTTQQPKRSLAEELLMKRDAIASREYATTQSIQEILSRRAAQASATGSPYPSALYASVLANAASKSAAANKDSTDKSSLASNLLSQRSTPHLSNIASLLQSKIASSSTATATTSTSNPVSTLPSTSTSTAAPSDSTTTSTQRPGVYGSSISNIINYVVQSMLSNKNIKLDIDEKERIRLENRTRKKKWREKNNARNKDNDLRFRVHKRANYIFGVEETPEKQKWVEDEFTKRKSKRIERLKKANMDDNAIGYGPGAPRRANTLFNEEILNLGTGPGTDTDPKASSLNNPEAITTAISNALKATNINIPHEQFASVITSFIGNYIQSSDSNREEGMSMFQVDSSKNTAKADDTISLLNSTKIAPPSKGPDAELTNLLKTSAATAVGSSYSKNKSASKKPSESPTPEKETTIEIDPSIKDSDKSSDKNQANNDVNKNLSNIFSNISLNAPKRKNEEPKGAAKKKVDTGTEKPEKSVTKTTSKVPEKTAVTIKKSDTPEQGKPASTIPKALPSFKLPVYKKNLSSIVASSNSSASLRPGLNAMSNVKSVKKPLTTKKPSILSTLDMQKSRPLSAAKPRIGPGLFRRPIYRSTTSS